MKYILSHKGRNAHSRIKCSKENIKDREGKQKFFLLLLEINVVKFCEAVRVAVGVKLLDSLIHGL